LNWLRVCPAADTAKVPLITARRPADRRGWRVLSDHWSRRADAVDLAWGNRLGAGAVNASMAGRRRRAGLAVAAVALLFGAVSSCGSAAGYDRGVRRHVRAGGSPVALAASPGVRMGLSDRPARIRPLITAQLAAIADSMTGR
jgi:hypothetical protein